MPISKLQQRIGAILRSETGFYTIRENYRPEWFTSISGSRLEMDFYIPEINATIEVQGIQHYKFTPIFHKTVDDFNRQQQRDEEKRNLCKYFGIALYAVDNEHDLFNVLPELKPLPEDRKKKLRFNAYKLKLYNTLQRTPEVTDKRKVFVHKLVAPILKGIDYKKRRMERAELSLFGITQCLEELNDGLVKHISRYVKTYNYFESGGSDLSSIH